MSLSELGVNRTALTIKKVGLWVNELSMCVTGMPCMLPWQGFAARRPTGCLSISQIQLGLLPPGLLS